MLIEIKSHKAIDEIERDLQASAASHQFGVLAIHNLKETMAKKGVELARECRVYEVCNPHQAKKVLDEDASISTALPCRISLYGGPDGYTLATLKPTELMKMFGKPAIEPVAQEVEEVIVQMMKDAAGA
jgi:uncharacterized protein (DUF302 family)